MFQQKYRIPSYFFYLKRKQNSLNKYDLDNEQI